MRLGHALARPGNAILDVQSIGEHCVVHYWQAVVLHPAHSTYKNSEKIYLLPAE